MNEQQENGQRPMARGWVPIAESMCNRAAQAIVVFTALLVGTLGYGAALLIFACAQLKLLFPDRVGIWISLERSGPSEELLGWCLIPIGIAASMLLLVGTTLLLKGVLRFTEMGSTMALSKQLPLFLR